MISSYLWMMGIPFLVAWEMVWKGIALWKAGKNQHLGWFIAMFVLNTIGILPIVYLLWFSEPKKRKR